MRSARNRFARPAVLGYALCIGAACVVGGCAGLDRLPAVPVAQAQKSSILDIPDARFQANDSVRINAVARQVQQRRIKTGGISRPLRFLVISGGGDDGAFGAGLLVGWSERGDRPQFDVVTGVSTGALSAPFAFLGRDHDGPLRRIYSESAAGDIFESRAIVTVLAQDGVVDSAPLRRMIDGYVDAAMVEELAAAYRAGRLLLILTTNLDQGRPVIWNLGAIAESRHPKARELIVDVLLASASIPAIFPPVMIDVSIDGQTFQEMHVDGGTVAQAFMYPPSFSLRRFANRAPGAETRQPVVYIIRNGRFSRPEANIERHTLAIAKQALATMTTASGVNDAYRMYLIAQRDGVAYNLASIEDDFEVPYKGPFDQGYMRSLFDHGYNKMRGRSVWQKVPPGYVR
jgi:predicted acylesterase/phospholipase RssA